MDNGNLVGFEFFSFLKDLRIEITETKLRACLKEVPLRFIKREDLHKKSDLAEEFLNRE